MESVTHGIVIYVFLLVVFRLSGKRTLAQTSPFDLILLLIVSETTQQAMVDDDHSIINALILIVTLAGMSVVLSICKHRSRRMNRWLDGVPVTLVASGKLQQKAMDDARIDVADILAAARTTQGLEYIEDVRLATLENDGHISIVPERR